MKSIHAASMLAVLTLFVLVSAQGCPSPAPTPPEPPPELTAAEQVAIQNGLRATSALESAADTTQNGTSTDALTERPNPAARMVGTCPIITTTRSTSESPTLSLAIDFGSGCTPAYLPGALCSGSATGTVTPSTNTVSVTFNNLAANGQTLDGTANLGFSRSGLIVGLTGTWNLQWATAADRITTAGEGTCQFNSTGFVTTIATFDGSVSDTQGTWGVTLTDVQTSYAAYGKLIPFAGVMTLHSDSIRPLWIRFTTATPSTGEIEISLDGTHYASMSIQNLIEML